MNAAATREEELDLVKRLFGALGRSYRHLEPSDRPDVIATLNDGRKVGIEVTVFHGDEATSVRGSALRAEEVKKARQTNESYAMSGASPGNYLSALEKRIEEKIRAAKQFTTGGYDALWLLIAASVPQSGAVASTFMPAALLEPEDLTKDLNSLPPALQNSPFEEAYLYSVMTGNAIYRWTRTGQWECLRPSMMYRVDLKSILHDPEWLRDPVGKAREEAYKALNELRQAKGKLK